MSEADVSAGLALPYAAVALLGKGGAVATLIMVFLAVTSAFSAELVATSSIFTYDIYRTYFKPDASGRSLVWMSHMCMVAYTAVICCVSVGLWFNGISMGYLYLLMGVLISAAVLPATLTLLWRGQNRWAATLSPIFGTAVAIFAWLVTAKKTCGKLDVVCTGSNDPMLAGNVAALLSPIVIIPLCCLIFGVDKYDWQTMMDIKKADDHDMIKDSGLDEDAQRELERSQQTDFDEEQRKLNRAFRIACTMTVILAISFLVLWPMPMYGSRYIFSKPFFTGWVSVGIIWIFCSMGAVGIYPLWESRATLTRVLRLIFTGKAPKKNIVHGQPAVVEEEASGTVTPEKKEALVNNV